MVNFEKEIENLKDIADKALIDFKKIMEYLTSDDEDLEDSKKCRGGVEE